MTARILPLPIARDDTHGTVVVMGDGFNGFEVAHESASGNSWGSFSGPYSSGSEAITAAILLNRDQYDGRCALSVCDAALSDRGPPFPSNTRGTSDVA